MEKREIKKLSIRKETLRALQDTQLAGVGGARPSYPQYCGTSWCVTRDGLDCLIETKLCA